MIVASPEHRPVLRVERYVPTPQKPAWAREQLSKLQPFSEWVTEEERSTEQCLNYIKLIAMLEAIARGEAIYLLEDKSADWPAQRPAAA